MWPSPVAPKAVPGRASIFFFEQRLAKLLRAEAQIPDVGEQVERSLRVVAVDALDLVQTAHDVSAALLEHEAHRL